MPRSNADVSVCMTTYDQGIQLLGLYDRSQMLAARMAKPVDVMSFLILSHILLYFLAHANEPVVIKGAGPAFAYRLLEQLMAEHDKAHPDENIHLQYSRKGTLKAKQLITGKDQSEGPISFAISNFALSPEERQNHKHLQLYPIVGGALVFVFNLPGINQLYLTRELLTDIFFGRIQYWDDPPLQTQNPSLVLPAKRIRMVARREVTSLTSVLTAALSSFSTEWKHGPGQFNDPKLTAPDGYSENWPNAEFFAPTSFDVAAVISSVPYSFGYTTIADATLRQAPIATVRNKHGNYITPDNITASIKLVISEAAAHLEDLHDPLAFNDHLQSHLIDDEHPRAYPIVVVSFAIFNISTTPGLTCVQTEALVDLMNYFYNDVDGCVSAIIHQHHLVAMDRKIKDNIIGKLLSNVTCEGTNVLQLIESQRTTTQEPQTTDSHGNNGSSTLALVLLICSVSVIATLVGVLLYYRHVVRKGIANEWLIDIEKLSKDSAAKQKYGWMKTQLKTVENPYSKNLTTRLWPLLAERSTEMGEKRIILYQSGIKISPMLFDFKTSKYLSKLSQQASHPNVVMFSGITVNMGGPAGSGLGLGLGSYYMYENPGKTNLHSFLATCPYKLKNNIMYSLASDVCAGMKFLHHHGIVHGILDTWTCLLDVNWTVKVSNWAQSQVAEMENQAVKFSVREHMGDIEDYQMVKRLAFRHPDILKGAVGLGEMKKHHDFYSFAMVLTEIFTRTPPFTEEARISGWKTMIDEIANGFELPTQRHDIPFTVRNLIKQLTAKKTSEINFDIAYSMLAVEGGFTGSNRRGIIDALMEAMEEYMIKLEQAVEANRKEIV